MIEPGMLLTEPYEVRDYCTTIVELTDIQGHVIDVSFRWYGLIELDSGDWVIAVANINEPFYGRFPAIEHRLLIRDVFTTATIKAGRMRFNHIKRVAALQNEMTDVG